VANGTLTLNELRNGLPQRARATSPAAVSEHQEWASAAPEDRPDDDVESPSLTDVLEFKAAVAEAVVAALIEAVPRIIVAAVTGRRT
jgi:hypothetical protein